MGAGADQTIVTGASADHTAVTGAGAPSANFCVYRYAWRSGAMTGAARYALTNDEKTKKILKTAYIDKNFQSLYYFRIPKRSVTRSIVLYLTHTSAGKDGAVEHTTCSRVKANRE